MVHYFGRAVAALVVAASLVSAASGLAAAVDWLTYGFDVNRHGNNPKESLIGTANAGQLQPKWSFDTGAPIVAQAVLATGVATTGGAKNVVYVGALNGFFFAIDARSGAKLWQRWLGTQQTTCDDFPNSQFGVIGAPTLDRGRHTVFAAGADGKVHAMDEATGAERPGWPLTITTNVKGEFVYGGLNQLGNRLYVATASACDIGVYHGQVAELDVSVPTVAHRWFPVGNTGPSGGGVWGPGGVSIDPAGGAVYAATGNRITPVENSLLADHVVRLTLDLGVVASHGPSIPPFDVDFGATPLLYQAPGCPKQLAVMNKVGSLFVYNRDSIGGGPVQRIQMADASHSSGGEFVGIPALSPNFNTIYVPNSSDSSAGLPYRHGLVALTMQSDCKLRLRWQRQIGPSFVPSAPPTVANGVVYYGAGVTNTIYAFGASGGAQLWSRTLGAPIFAAPMVVNGRLFVGSFDHKLYAFGLPST